LTIETPVASALPRQWKDFEAEDLMDAGGQPEAAQKRV
jgi:hypothetical protein